MDLVVSLFDMVEAIVILLLVMFFSIMLLVTVVLRSFAFLIYEILKLVVVVLITLLLIISKNIDISNPLTNASKRIKNKRIASHKGRFTEL